MNTREIDTALAAANPVSRATVAELPLDAAEQELLQAIVAEPRRTPDNRRARPRRPRRRQLALVGAVLAAAGLFLAVVGTGDRTDGPESAFGAELVRFAESSPLLLLDAPGWTVDYADEQTAREGEMRFTDGATGAADLNWRPRPLTEWVRDRAASASRSTTAPVLGTTAKVFQYEGGSPGNRDVTALWVEQGRVLEFRSQVAGLAAFKERLASLRRVDAETWLSALPASVVKAANRDSVVRQMLRGVPLPPGFDPSRIPDEGLTKDRYQLGATVSGTVACTWFQRWSQARTTGNRARERRAIAALGTAKDWPILREMSKEGGYPEVLQEYAAAMPSGRWYGRPLEGDVNSGLGCPRFGIRLRNRP
jgi:hypothetical protein